MEEFTEERHTSFFDQHNPFDQLTSDELRNLVTGVVSSPSVNVDLAKAVGINILKNMTQVVSEYVYKASSNAINMSKKLMLKGKKGETVSVDPILLFQRLI